MLDGLPPHVLICWHHLFHRLAFPLAYLASASISISVIVSARSPASLALDDKGFILTGRDLDTVTEAPAWTLGRPPQMLETSLPGVFAVGDVRSGNVKRIASAVGEGAIAVHLVHRALADQ